MSKKKVALAVTAGAALLTLAGCWGGSPVSEQDNATPTPSPSSSCVLSCQDVPQADHSGPPALDDDATAEKAAVDASMQVMAAYADTAKTKEDWFKALAPLITTAWAQDAQYIQPSRLPVRKVTTGPSVVPLPVQDGYQVRVKFGTNAGDWVVIMTRASESAPWLASNVLPSTDVQ